VQTPIAPPYEEAVRRRKQQGTCKSSNSLPVAAASTSKNIDEPMMMMNINLSFGGGAELLVGGKRERVISLPKETRMKGLLNWMVDNIIQERPELLVQDGDVRPGILVLINDTDWELCDKTEYPLESGDTITFISTLHGG
jgi:ubiquitin related modifier 1